MTKNHIFPIIFVGFSLILGTIFLGYKGYMSYSLLLSPFGYYLNVIESKTGWKGTIFLILIGVALVYLAYKGIQYFLIYAEQADKKARQCPSCQELGAMEMTNKYITNKQRKHKGYSLETFNGKQVRRQKYVTTEYFTEQWQCVSCSHQYERQKTENYNS